MLAYTEKEKEELYQETLMDAWDYVESLLERKFNLSGLEFLITRPTRALALGGNDGEAGQSGCGS